MVKKLVSLVQPNFQQGPSELNAFYLPYTVGILWAYAQSQGIEQYYDLDRIVWRRDNIQELAQDLKHNDVVIFSTYVWNREYNYCLARELKKLKPGLKTVFGGPEIPHRDPNLFKQYPFMDFVIRNEGEISLAGLLMDLAQDRSITVPGVLINDHAKGVDTGEPERINDLSVIPSPYLTGFFDQIIQDNPDVNWNGTLETNRGCPYQCTFCDWGSLTYSKVRHFPLDRVLRELEWLGQHCIYLTIADANFGLFVERDAEISDKILEVQRVHRKLASFNTSWAKNTRKETTEIIKKFIKNTVGHASPLTVSVQTMDENVLDIIKRKNLKQHQLEEIFRACRDSGIPVYTEMILGLPGETLDSWKKSIFRIFRAGNHNGIDFYQSQLLENSEMNQVQREIYGLKTAWVYDYMAAVDKDPLTRESIQVVIATDTMDQQAMLEAQVWTSFLVAFHVCGYSTWIAKYLEKVGICQMEEFYDLLYDKCKKDPVWFGQKILEVQQNFTKWAQQGYFENPAGCEFPLIGNNVMYRLQLDMHLENQLDHGFSLISEVLRENYHVSDDIIQELFRLQRSSVITYDKLKSLPTIEQYDYNFIGYLDYGQDLHEPVKVKFDFNESKMMSHKKFHENLYFGRKRYFAITKMNWELVS